MNVYLRISVAVFAVVSLLSTVLAQPASIAIIQANQSWQNTGFTVQAGDTVYLMAEGIYSYSYNPSGSNRSGWTNAVHTGGMAGGSYLAPNLPGFTAIIKFGENGEVYAVRPMECFLAPSSSTIYATINDSNFGDNYGYYILSYVNASRPRVSVTETENTVEPSWKLNNNFPNPFNPTTTISYSILKRGNVEVSVFDMQGRLVRNLLQTEQLPGEHQVIWDSRNENGAPVSSGAYFYQVRVDGISGTKQMILLK